MSVFETERLVMRPWREDDAENLYKYASDPEVGPAAGWPVHTSVEDSLRVLREVLIEDKTWAVTIKPSDEPVGSIGVFRTDAPNGNGEPEIGYWIGRPYWGNGYIPEAVRALIGRCFDEGAESVWCSHFAGNDKSRRVIEKCGFKFAVSMTVRAALLDGMPEYETFYYKITRKEWEHD